MTDIYERLVHQTVSCVLFGEPSSGAVSTGDEVIKGVGTEDSLLHLFLRDGEDPAEDEDNNADEVRRDMWLVECVEWPIERLRREKAAVKRYLRSQKLQKLSGDMLVLHEVYALLKLFLLERDPHYRRGLQHCTSSFLTSLHVQLSLYATYFERAYGRQISKKTDVKPIETLYELFVQQTE
ncbi:hypothetical protein GN958_ATG10490 [Phytophthora infestans]|nr:hypothetical protein GN958_ATG10490 [Phytophthora infestans]